MITPDIVNFKKGITFYFLNDSKFKTASLKISFVRPLLKSEVTLNSLIPAIIRRGSEKHPDTKELNIYLDYLCGAEFTSGVRKKGENQLITFSYKTVSDKFFKEEKPFLQLIDLMEETLFNPLVADNGFKKEYVDREKENLDQMIKSVVNDKREYAKKRLIESMYDNCPYGLFEYGYSDDLKNINETNLFKHYLKVISESEIKVFVSGNFDKNEVLQKLTEIFGNKEVTPICVTFPEKDSYKEKYDIITEEDDVTQGKLVIGFKTNVTTDSSLYFPMLVANNLFGGSVHSKLFTVVREKMSLAYYAGSSFSAFKGFISFKSDECTSIYRFKKNRQIAFAGAIQTCRLGTTNSTQLINQLAAAILLIILVIDELHVGNQLIHGLLRQVDDLDAHLGQLSLVCLGLSSVIFHHHCSILGEDVNQNFLILSGQGLELSLVHADDVQGADVVGLGVVLGNLVQIVHNAGSGIDFEAVNNALVHSGVQVGESDGSGVGAQTGDAVREQLDLGAADLHTSEVFQPIDGLLLGPDRTQTSREGNQALQTNVVVVQQLLENAGQNFQTSLHQAVIRSVHVGQTGNAQNGNASGVGPTSTLRQSDVGSTGDNLRVALDLGTHGAVSIALQSQLAVSTGSQLVSDLQEILMLDGAGSPCVCSNQFDFGQFAAFFNSSIVSGRGFFFLGAAASDQRQCHDQSQQSCKKLLHKLLSPFCFFGDACSVGQIAGPVAVTIAEPTSLCEDTELKPCGSNVRTNHLINSKSRRRQPAVRCHSGRNPRHWPDTERRLPHLRPWRGAQGESHRFAPCAFRDH